MLLDRVPVILYIAEAGVDGGFRYVSPQIESMLGYSEQEWLADSGIWARSLHPDDREGVLAREQQMASNGQSLDPVPEEYRLLHRDGHPVWVRDDGLLLVDAAGGSRWYGVMTDITDRRRAEAELERRAAQQAAVARLGEHALERVAIDELFAEAMAAISEVLGAECAMVGQLIEGGRRIQLVAATGPAAANVGDSHTLDPGDSQSEHALRTREPVVVEDWTAETRFRQATPHQAIGIASGITVQIEGTDGPFGLLSAHALSPRRYLRSDVAFVQALANVLADAVERERTEAAIEHRALHDPLTGLPNRVLFLDRLEHALERLRRRAETLAAVLFIDLDHFKLVNDSLGHQAGDELLAAVAARLRQTVRPTDTVARFGGDEFGLLLEDVGSERDAIAMAERIAAVFARPFALDSSEHFVTTSVGIALASGGELPSDLIRDADAAMYRAKDRGRARYELFDELMRARAIARLRIENDLRRAIERGELALAYQPIVALADRSVVGVEALLRWEHPRRGPIGPAEFVPVAEETGLIERIGRWVLARACRDAVAWSLERPDAAPVWMSVNLSPVQIAQGGFETMLERILATTGHDPGLLCLEITESLLLDETSTTSETLLALKRLGVQIALDDFGTGYSSLSYLTRLPLHALKVDRSFISTLGAERRSEGAIAEAIVAMARALSLAVIAEGVEREEQVHTLRALGCGFAQGYLFSEPVPAGSIAKLLHDGARLPARRPN